MQGSEGELITIGELARQTGLTPATLRMWESRHDFPRAHRLASGHRRYSPDTVPAVQAVLRRQAAGVRLDAAIAEVGTTTPATPSVFAELRNAHPTLLPQVLRKSTLLALSHAIEDECVARADRAVLFGAFQHPRHLAASTPRWEDLARTVRATYAFVVGEADVRPGSNVVAVALSPGAPLRREWVVVIDGSTLPAVLSAWELPGQHGVPDADRLFEALWTLEPAAVRTAARTCASIAADAGVPEPMALVADLDLQPGGGAELAAATRLFSRMVGYLERSSR